MNPTAQAEALLEKPETHTPRDYGLEKHLAELADPVIQYRIREERRKKLPRDILRHAQFYKDHSGTGSWELRNSTLLECVKLLLKLSGFRDNTKEVNRFIAEMSEFVQEESWEIYNEPTRLSPPWRVLCKIWRKVHSEEVATANKIRKYNKTLPVLPRPEPPPPAPIQKPQMAMAI
ncbi:MAG: hypothetical protein PHS95_03475 [Candidatus Pacebacteria bacterium]|nr:hypothetical protein [Candidatus Paceibacterota bacterium]